MGYLDFPTRHEKPTLITRGTHTKVSHAGMLLGGFVESRSMQQLFCLLVMLVPSSQSDNSPNGRDTLLDSRRSALK